MTLMFRAIPDYEQPADVPPTDNDYQVSVVATVPGPPALATPYPVRVQVVDVEEGSAMPVLAAPEQTPSTQAESVGGMVRSVVHFYKDVVGWALRGVFHHLRDVFNASKRDAKVSGLATYQSRRCAVAVYAGALSAMETSGRLHVLVDKPTSAVTGYEYQLYEGADRLLDWTSAGIAAHRDKLRGRRLRFPSAGCSMGSRMRWPCGRSTREEPAVRCGAWPRRVACSRRTGYRRWRATGGWC